MSHLKSQTGSFGAVATASNKTISSNIEDGIHIQGDKKSIESLFSIVLDNAVKYRRDDEPLQLSVSTKNQGQRLIITVQDNGIGIRHDDLKHIFHRFYRVHTGNKHDVKGFGLGLAYVKGMVELMHGNIKAESELGRGTKFIISLPLID